MMYLLSGIITLLPFFQTFDWVRFEMTQRTNHAGKTTTTDALVYFGKNSDLVIHHISPIDVYILNNRDGELRIYNPEENEVYQTMNYNLNSEGNHFYHFLMNKTDDMGLTPLGFTLMESRLDDGLLISMFDASPEVKEYFEKVELVHKGRQPIFVGYIDKKGNYLKKVFYYDYQDVSGIDFPMSITEISYLPSEDSVITKTSFSAFRFDHPMDQEMIQFQVPDHAILIE